MRRFISLWILLLIPSTAIAQDGADLNKELESIYDTAAKRVNASVVSILVDREPEKVKRRSGFGLSMMDGGVFKTRPKAGVVTGTIIHADGLILTTHFNVKGKVHSIKVRLLDGREFDAKLQGYNATYDIALLKIEAKSLPTLKKASLDYLRVGKVVMAVGRAPDRKNLTINPGIVSAPFRMSGRGIQVDSLLNYGNVGGPLVDRNGRMIGITCKVDTRYSGSHGQNSGIGFAVTWDKLGKILPALKKGKNVGEARRAFLGIQADTDSNVVGVKIAEVVPTSAAEKAGIKPGDIIIEFDGKKITNFDMLRAAIVRKSPGDKAKVTVRRAGKEIKFDLLLGWTPGE